MTESPPFAHALRMSLGPVQPFIAAGRRTRDLWAGSFLLSRLAGEAMDAVRAGGGRITLPAVETEGEGVGEETLRAIEEARTRFRQRLDGRYDVGRMEELPRGPVVGTLVNHFRAEIPPHFDAKSCRPAVQKRFEGIASSVFEVFIGPALRLARDPRLAGGEPILGEVKEAEIRDRWQKQTAGAASFFELLWVRGPLDADWTEESCWLARRKTWREHVPPIEIPGPESGGVGDRCPIHPEFTELGGFARARGERATQEAFWQVLRYVVGRRMYDQEQTADWAEFPDAWPPRAGGEGSSFDFTLELRPGERLSGFALVKRLFPLLSPRRLVEAIGWLPTIPDSLGNPDQKITEKHAQMALRNWPSTAFVAAIPWIIEVYRHDPHAADNYAEKQYRTLRFDRRLKSERPQSHKVPGIDALKGIEPERRIPFFAVLDGTLHFPRGLDKHRIVERRYSSDRRRDRDEEKQALASASVIAAELNRNYDALLTAVDSDKSHALHKARPKPFYAFLEMDGDSMGPVFSSDRKTAEIASRALLDFAMNARLIVREHDGIPVYAGADDVLALLPTETAIDCAAAIRRKWDTCFETAFRVAGQTPPVSSISASITFADYQVPLDFVRRTTHERLDNVAKDGNGRDSVAVAVVKSGGIVADWVTTWTQPAKVWPVDQLQQFASAQARQKTFASRLPYQLRSRFESVLSSPSFTDGELVALVEKELLDSAVAGMADEQARKRLAAAIVDLLSRWRRRVLVPAGYSYLREKRTVDALLISRFLVENSLWAYAADGLRHPPATGPAR